MDMDTNTQHLSDYLAILRRRRKQIFGPAALIATGSLLLAFFLPPIYRSTATILIEQEEVPQELVRSTITSYAVERIQIISRRVMTRDNLERIGEKSGLLKKDRRPEETETVLKEMRKAIKVEVISADVSDPKKGISDARAAIAFELSFESGEPAQAKKVADELLNVFLEENRRMRIEKAQGATHFLSEEATRLSERISVLEAQLAAHKSKNTGQLPELMNMNMSLLEQTQRELENLERQIYTLEERKVQLQGQLAQVEPYIGAGPGGRLKELQSQYLAAVAVYAPDHPDVVRLRREIELLKKETGMTEQRDALDAELKRVRADLARARERYGENHPDVVRLRKTQATLEDKLKESASTSPLGMALKPDNPAYISLKTQLDTVDLNLKAAKEARARAKEKLTEYEQRIIRTPRVEQEALAMRREYENAVAKFKEIRDKQLQAQVAEQLERESKGERFSVVEPPQVPTAPVKPNRLGILLLGTFLAVGAGVGNAAYTEYKDQTIRGPKILVAVLRTPPLAVIPYISNGQEQHASSS